MTKEPSKQRFRTNFLYGLVVLLPIIATIWLVYFSIDLMSGPISAVFGHKIPLLISFVLSIAVIAFVGLIARNVLGGALIDYVERIVRYIPVINMIYKSFKQVVDAFSFQERLMKPVFVEYPRKGMHALGFLTNESPSGIRDLGGNDCVAGKVAVFIPTTPNPTSGYFLYLDATEITPLDMSIEDSVKLLMSAGVLLKDKK